MKIRYAETALVEINEIFAYLFERNEAAARRVVARVERAVQNLGDFPEIAQQSDEPGVRRMPVGRYPFIIFYSIEDDEVVILHVRHGARKSPWEDDSA
jgi:toxin ParE1/3/4